MKRLSVRFLTLLFICAVPVLIYRPVLAVQGEPRVAPEPEENLGWEPTLPGLELSTASTHGADEAVIALAPNGQLMVVYNDWVLPPPPPPSRPPRDPYYVISNDNGDNWSDPAPIFTSADANVDSDDIAMIFDDNGVAHVVWVELEPNNYELLYSRNSGSGWIAPLTISVVASNAPFMAQPSIKASGTSPVILDVVWTEADQSNGSNATPDIFHARSLNGGTSWTNTGRVQAVTAPGSLNPDIAIDQDGVLHVVWEEAAGGIDSNALYVRSVGAPTGTTVTWESPLAINLVDPDITRARRPRIEIGADGLYVALTDYSAPDDQRVASARCAADCGVLDNWTISVISDAYEVNGSDPFDLRLDLTTYRDTVFVFFHGTPKNGPNSNELIVGIAECENFANAPVTDSTLRGINPVAVVTDSGWLHVAYERVDLAAGAHQIYYLRNTIECRTMMPLVVSVD